MTTDTRETQTYTIRQLCHEFGCTARALRFYEDKGLLSPQRAGLNRIYSHRDRARLLLILRGKHVGLSLAEIRELLDLRQSGQGGTQQTEASLGKMREKLVDFERQRVELDKVISDLQDGIAQLERQLAQVRGDLPSPDGNYDQKLDGTRG
jgi:DNA-binding transcriptional MerR regulator